MGTKIVRAGNRDGLTLVEVMVSSALLGLAFIVVISAIVMAKANAVNNNLRTVALFTAEQSLEELRYVGRAALYQRLTVDTSGGAPIWTYDPIADGTLPSTYTLRKGYVPGAGGSLVAQPGADITMTQQCEVMAADDSGAPDLRWLTVTTDIAWSFRGKNYSDSLHTIIAGTGGSGF